MAHCPKCKTKTLAPTLLAAGLSAKGCQTCHGVLMDLLAYRAWADQRGIDALEASPSSSVQVDDTSQAIVCPNCSSIMSKFRLSRVTGNKLDFCTRCDEVWLDDGEWDQLKDLGLRNSLGSVFTEIWQRRVRGDLARRSHESTLRERFGDDYERIAEFRAWVLKHPKYESALAWLSDPED